MEVCFEGYMFEAIFGLGIFFCNYDGLMYDLSIMSGIFL